MKIIITCLQGLCLVIACGVSASAQSVSIDEFYVAGGGEERASSEKTTRAALPNGAKFGLPGTAQALNGYWATCRFTAVPPSDTDNLQGSI